MMAKKQSSYIDSLEGGAKKKKPKKAMIIAVICVCAAAIGISAWQLITPAVEDSASEGEYQTVAGEFVVPEEEEPPYAGEQPLPAEEVVEKGLTPMYDVDFKDLKEVNPDVCAWIVSFDTPINYPVVQAKNNTYYLNRLYNKKRNRNGSIFLDHRNSSDFSDKNNVLYGHHMKNGSMFGSLVEYKKEGYFEKHPYFELYTPEANYLVEVFSVYVTSAGDNYIQTAFASDAEYAAFIDKVAAASEVSAGFKPTTQDSILTLSTCTYDYTDARFVVHGKMVKM